MKIRSFEITNYKCHSDTHCTHCSDFHAFVGRNSSGKTSIIELCRLVKHPHPIDKEVVFGGIDDYTQKEITFKIKIEVPEDKRKEYLVNYLNLNEQLADQLLPTMLLKTFTLTYVIRVPGAKYGQDASHNVIILAGMECTDSRGNNNQIISLAKPTKLSYVNIPRQAEKVTGVNIASFDQFFRNLLHNQTNASGLQDSLPSSSLQYIIIRDFRESLKFLDSVRQSHKKVSTKYVDDITAESESGQTLVNLMETVYINNLKRFNEIADLCMRLFPDIVQIHPQRLPDNHIRIMITKRNIPYEIDLAQEGKGIDQLLIIVWAVASTPRGTIWFLDEPELHLHPGAQKLLYDFLKEEAKRGKQIFVATHSMVFIHSSELNEVSLLLDNQGHTELAGLDDLVQAEKNNLHIGLEEARKHIYESLGYDPTFAFEPKIVVMIEGTADEKILTNFCKTLGKPVNQHAVRFLVVGDKRKSENFSPIFANGLSGKKCLIVLDNDKESPTSIKEKILKIENEYRKTLKLNNLLLRDDNFHLYPENVYSIEYYLLEPEAICKAGGSDDIEVIKKVRKEIDAKMESLDRKEITPKSLLEDIWNNALFGEYREVETASKIAEFVSKKHLERFDEILSLVDAISK